jgi:hypothetical protein
MLNEEFSGRFRDEDDCAYERQRCTKDQVGPSVSGRCTDGGSVWGAFQLLFGSVTCINENRHTSEQAGKDAIVMDEVIVKVKDVWTINAQLPGDPQDCARTGSSRFLKGPDLDAQTLSLCRQPAGMGEAID